MARRYATRQRLDEGYEADACDSLARTVHEPDREPRNTGLLDKRGFEIVAIETPDPIGYIRFGG